MIVNIRKGVHHTNSSSVHAIAIHTSHMNSAPLEPEYFDDLIHVGLEFFDWGPGKYDDLYHKLIYLLAMVKETEYKKAINESPDIESTYSLHVAEIKQDTFKATEGFKAIDDAIFRYCGYHLDVDDTNGVGGIDHQSCEGFRSLADFLDFWCVKLEDFLFDTAYELWISNDNGGKLPTQKEIDTFENKDWFVGGENTCYNLVYYKDYGSHADDDDEDDDDSYSGICSRADDYDYVAEAGGEWEGDEDEDDCPYELIEDTDYDDDDEDWLDSSDSGCFSTGPEGKFLDEGTIGNCANDGKQED